METKKLTAAQLQRRLNNALVLVEKTKDTKEVFFDDKGLRLTATDEYCLVQTGYHTHVFKKFNMSGYSKPCMYVERLIDIAIENDCYVKDEDGNLTRSYKKLIDTLKAKTEKDEYNIAMYTDWYLFNIFYPLYSISENAAQQFLVYHSYLHNLASQCILLDEHKNGLTNKEFIKKYNDMMKEFLDKMEVSNIFEPMSDEERMKREMEAVQEQEVEQAMKG